MGMACCQYCISLALLIISSCQLFSDVGTGALMFDCVKDECSSSAGELAGTSC